MIDRFRKGKRIYTHWDKKSEQVTVQSKMSKKSIPPLIDVASPVPEGIWADESVIYRREDEYIIDFISSTGSKKRVVSRVIMSPRAVKKFLLSLQEKC